MADVKLKTRLEQRVCEIRMALSEIATQQTLASRRYMLRLQPLRAPNTGVRFLQTIINQYVPINERTAPIDISCTKTLQYNAVFADVPRDIFKKSSNTDLACLAGAVKKVDTS